MSDKKTNRVTTFFDDAAWAALIEDAYQAGREPADYLRYLHREEHKRKVGAWAAECQRKQLELDAMTSHLPPQAGLSSVDALRPRPSGFADTVPAWGARR